MAYECIPALDGCRVFIPGFILADVENYLETIKFLRGRGRWTIKDDIEIKKRYRNKIEANVDTTSSQLLKEYLREFVDDTGLRYINMLERQNNSVHSV